MFGWAALDVAIGLFFMYLLLSMIGTTVQESIASLLKLRASNLREGLENLLNDKQLLDDPKFKDLTAALYDHPAVKSLYRSQRRILGIKLESGPSYIPSRTFVMALLDEIRVRNAERAGNPADQIKRIGVDQLFRDARTIVDAMPDCDLKTQLTLLTGDIQAHADDLEQQVTAAVGRIENWFNQSMDRVSGWYKRKAKFLAIVVGCAMAVVLNADTVHVAKTLWTDSNLRETVAAGASAYLEQRPPDAGGQTDSGPDQRGAARVGVLLESLSQTGLPVGWQFKEEPDGTVGSISLQPHQNMLVAVIGWIITGFALSLGAGFWFDTLSKIVNLRGSGTQVSTQTGKAVEKS